MLCTPVFCVTLGTSLFRTSPISNKKYYDIIPDKPLPSGLPPDPTNLTKMSVREIARWILTCDREVNFHENYTVNFFARYSLPGKAGPFRMDKAYARRRLSAAMRILDRFCFVRGMRVC